jgi:hypothetical protein
MDPLAMWHLLVEDYSRRKLTFLTDKLPAIAGIAHVFHSSHSGPFLAGIWGEELPIGLLWRHTCSETERSGRRPKELETLPSWSWTSVEGPVSWLKMYVQNMRSDLVLETPNIRYQGKPISSPIVSAPLKFYSRPEEVTIEKELASLRLHEIPQVRLWSTKLTWEGKKKSTDEHPGQVCGTCILDYNLPDGVDTEAPEGLTATRMDYRFKE